MLHTVVTLLRKMYLLRRHPVEAVVSTVPQVGVVDIQHQRLHMLRHRLKVNDATRQVLEAAALHAHTVQVQVEDAMQWMRWLIAQ